MRDPSITVLHLCSMMNVSVMQLASFHSARWMVKLVSVDSTNLTGSVTLASRHGSEGFLIRNDQNLIITCNVN